MGVGCGGVLYQASVKRVTGCRTVIPRDTPETPPALSLLGLGLVFGRWDKIRDEG